MTIRIFTGTQIHALEKDVNEYLANFDNNDVVSIQMTETDRYNSVMVVTK